MSIGALAGAAAVSTALDLGGKLLGLGLAKVSGAVDHAKAKADAAAAKAQAQTRAQTQATTLADIRQKGVYAWAQAQKFDTLKTRITQQVMTARKLDAAALAAMDPTERASAESSLTAEIAKRTQGVMQEALEGQAQMAAKAGKPPAPLLIDIKV